MLNLIHIFAATCSNSFFGLKPWFAYLDLDSKCEIKNFNILPGSGEPSDVPLILLAVVDDLLRVAGLIAVAFVIYGAFQYVASQGNPDSAARAQATVINALIGLAVSIVAVATVSFIGSRLR